MADEAAVRSVIADLCDQSFATAKAHGFWQGRRTFAEKIALMHSELSEALEEARDVVFDLDKWGYEDDCLGGDKPVGVAVELADCLIRIFDACGSWDIPLAEALLVKMKYNEQRPHKHGKAF